MKGIRAVLKDRRRSQHGGVLSGVLFILAFVAIIAGAVMSEVSTNFILSSNLMRRSLNEVTVNSAMELALDQLETNSISGGCPSLGPAQLNLNGRFAVPSYKSCWLAYREKLYTPIASSAAFTVDGSHSIVPTANPYEDLYVVGDKAGNVYQIPFGSVTPNWTYPLPGSVTGPPITVQDIAGGTPQDLMTLVPMNPGGGAPSTCTSGGGGCVAMLADDTNASPLMPDAVCYMAASATVTSAAAMGANYSTVASTVAFFGDQSGAVFAYAASERTVPCPQKAKSTANQQAVVAGPFVFAGPANVDEVYVVTVNSVLRYTYTEPQNQSPKLVLAGTLPLPWSGVVGVALEKTSLSAKLAITFGNGHVALVQLATSFAMSVVATAALPTNIQGAAVWSHNPALNPVDQIAVGGTNGFLYLFDTGLNQIASLGAAGAQVLTGLASDSLGEWFYGDGSGYVHEIQRLSGQATMTEVARFGPVAGGISSALQVAPCSGMICLYLATQSGNVYRVPLDARDVVMTACISASLPTCSGANPRLWTKMEVGREGNPSEVHVQGWSYYSG